VSVATDLHTGAAQGVLWSARAQDWATYQEPQHHEIYTSVLVHVPKVAGQRILDVGCGSGAFIRRAAKHGATVSGLDAATGLVTIARRRVPSADLRVGDLESLPYDDATFDIVTGFDAFSYAADPVAALTEAHRVLKPRGLVAAVTWGPPEECQGAGYLEAVSPFLPPSGEGIPDPFALSGAGALSELVVAAGFGDPVEHDVTSTWEYDDESTLLRGLLSAGPLVRAVAHSGSYAVTSAVLKAVEAYRTVGGGYRLRNVFRYVVAAA
jgi:SAM-dependent methyltransferase